MVQAVSGPRPRNTKKTLALSSLLSLESLCDNRNSIEGTSRELTSCQPEEARERGPDCHALLRKAQAR